MWKRVGKPKFRRGGGTIQKRCKYRQNKAGKFRITKTCRNVYGSRRVAVRTRRHRKGRALRKYYRRFKWVWGRQIKKRGNRYARKRILVRTYRGKRRVVRSYFRSCPNQKRCAKIFARRHKPRKGAAGRKLCYTICKKRKNGKRTCFRACKKRISKVIVKAKANAKAKGVKSLCTKSCTTVKTVIKGKKGKKGAKGKPVVKVSTKCVVRCTGLLKRKLVKLAPKKVSKKTTGKKKAAPKKGAPKKVVKKVAKKKR